MPFSKNTKETHSSKIQVWQSWMTHGGFQKWGVPPNHPFSYRIFHQKNHPAIGDPPWKLMFSSSLADPGSAAGCSLRAEASSEGPGDSLGWSLGWGLIFWHPGRSLVDVPEIPITVGWWKTRGLNGWTLMKQQVTDDADGRAQSPAPGFGWWWPQYDLGRYEGNTIEL